MCNVTCKSFEQCDRHLDVEFYEGRVYISSFTTHYFQNLLSLQKLIPTKKILYCLIWLAFYNTSFISGPVKTVRDSHNMLRSCLHPPCLI